MKRLVNWLFPADPCERYEAMTIARFGTILAASFGAGLVVGHLT